MSSSDSGVRRDFTGEAFERRPWVNKREDRPKGAQNVSSWQCDLRHGRKWKRGRQFENEAGNFRGPLQLGATLVGEPTGGTPSGYGEVKTLTLPNSKLQVRFTSKFFSVPKLLDTDSLQPDILAPRTFRDALAGRDAGLEAALAARVSK